MKWLYVHGHPQTTIMKTCEWIIVKSQRHKTMKTLKHHPIIKKIFVQLQLFIEDNTKQIKID